MTDINHLKLRAVEPEDVDRLFRWENDPENWLTSCNLAPMSRFQVWEYVKSYDSNPFFTNQLLLIISVAEEPVGYVELYDLSARHSRGMLGIYIAPDRRGSGYGSKAIEMLLRYSRDSLGLRLLGAETAADNPSAVGLFQKAGFSLTGRRPGWYRRGNSAVDALLFQREQIGHNEG